MKKIPVGALLFALVWALALCLPPVRDVRGSAPTLWRWRAPQTFDFDNSAPDWTPPRGSGDSVADEWDIEIKFLRPLPDQVAWFAELDTLAARHPKQLWLRAVQLRVPLLMPFQLDADTSNRAMNAGEKRQLPEWKRAAQVAADAARRESDNAFWPWMEAVFHFALRQNEAGVACIERAGHCTRFQDYSASTTRARIALWERTSHPSWEQKLALWYAVRFEHLGPMRGASNAAALAAWEARKGGDNARALDIGAAALRANYLMRRDGDFFVVGAVAQSNARAALEKLSGQLTWLERYALQKNEAVGETLEEQARTRDSLRQKWARFARDNGRPDLASLADWMTDDSQMRLTFRYDNGDFWTGFGLPSASSRFAVTSQLFLLGLAALCFLFAGVWLLGALWPSRFAEAPARGQVAACANFGFWALASVVAVAIKTNWLFEQLQPFTSRSGTEPFPLVIVVALVLGCWLLPVAFMAWKRDRSPRWIRPARPLNDASGSARRAAWMVSGGGALLLVVGEALHAHVPRLGFICGAVAFASLTCALVLTVARRTQTWPRLRLEGQAPLSPELRWLRLARAGAWLAVLLCASLFLNGAPSDIDLPPASQFFLLPVALLALAVAIVLGRKIGRGDGFAFRLATRTAGVLSLAGSVAFLMLALAVWPLRAELNRQLDRRLTMREEDWLKEQLAKYPPAPRTN